MRKTLLPTEHSKQSLQLLCNINLTRTKLTQKLNSISSAFLTCLLIKHLNLFTTIQNLSLSFLTTRRTGIQSTQRQCIFILFNRNHNLTIRTHILLSTQLKTIRLRITRLLHTALRAHLTCFTRNPSNNLTLTPQRTTRKIYTLINRSRKLYHHHSFFL